jgi:hypothetical protein
MPVFIVTSLIKGDVYIGADMTGALLGAAPP